MLKQRTSLRRAAIVAIAAASISIPALSVAQAHEQTGTTVTAKTHLKKHKHAQAMHREIYVAASAGPAIAGCTWPYRNMTPPCMATWPEGDPHYHGSRPGVSDVHY